MTLYSEYKTLYPEQIACLERARAGKRFSHAFLISSVSEKLRNDFAIITAQIAGCPDFDGCHIDDSCQYCRKLEDQTYPELRILSPVGKRYQIQVGERDNPEPNTVRDFINSFALTSWKNSWRKIGIIYDCDRMGTEAQNALLKTLEEPPPDTTLILVTANPTALLPTTRSRCQQIILPTKKFEYSFAGADELFAILREMCFGKKDIITAEKCASGIIGIASSLFENVEARTKERFASHIDIAKQMEDAPMVKRLEKRQEDAVNGAYMRERRSFLSAISCFCSQIFMLSSGVAFKDLPNPELFGDTPLPEISPQRGKQILTQSEELEYTLRFNVNEELALRTFVLNTIMKQEQI